MKDRMVEFQKFAHRFSKLKDDDDSRAGSVSPTALSSVFLNPTSSGSVLFSTGGIGASGAASSSQSDFARASSRIGHGIHTTSQKLQRLAQVAKRTSLFDDPAQEINTLTAVIKQDITALNTAISELQLQMPSCSGYFDAGSSKQGADHSATVVESLKQRLLGATREFKEVLTIRQGAIKAHSDRRQLFSAEQGSAANTARAAIFSGDHQRLGSTSSWQKQTILPLANHSPQQAQLQLQHNADNIYMYSRAEALQNIEHTINELGGIFTQLATMVAEQGELAVRIDENMDDSLTNVDNAQTQLLKYFKSISGNRWLILKVFGVIMSFLIIFLLFVA